MCAFDVPMMNPFIVNAMKLTVPLFGKRKREKKKKKSAHRKSPLTIPHFFIRCRLIRSKFNYIKSEPMFEIENSTKYLLAIKFSKKRGRTRRKKRNSWWPARAWELVKPAIGAITTVMATLATENE